MQSGRLQCLPRTDLGHNERFRRPHLASDNVGFDGNTEPATIGVRDCPTEPGRGRRLLIFFAVDDARAYQGSRADVTHHRLLRHGHRRIHWSCSMTHWEGQEYKKGEPFR